MQQPGRSISRRALFFSAWLFLLLSAATLRRACAQANEVAEIAYEAPRGCPSKQQFQQRLRARLGGATPIVHALALRITLHETHTRGELTVTSGPRKGARREVEAASCEEAVDALTLVTALLIEPEQIAARRAPAQRSLAKARPERPAVSPPVDAPRGDSQVPGSRTTAPAPADQASSPAASAQPVPAQQPGQAQAATAVVNAAGEQTLAPPSQPAKGRRMPLAPGAEARSHRTLSVELAAAALLASGTLPALRPGFEARSALVHGFSRALAGSAELGVRGLAPHVEKRAQGRAQFTFYGATAALCLEHRAARLPLSISACARGELARLSARGRSTEAPKRADVLWSALGPCTRAALHLSARWSLELGAELLFPLARDRFLIASEELWRVPLLTFRGSLGIGLRFE